jgi:hypothetical protein
MVKYSCPWCKTWATSKTYIQSHMFVCSKAPKEFKSGEVDLSSSDYFSNIVETGYDGKSSKGE